MIFDDNGDEGRMSTTMNDGRSKRLRLWLKLGYERGDGFPDYMSKVGEEMESPRVCEMSYWGYRSAHIQSPSTSKSNDRRRGRTAESRKRK